MITPHLTSIIGPALVVTVLTDQCMSVLNACRPIRIGQITIQDISPDKCRITRNVIRQHQVNIGVRRATIQKQAQRSQQQPPN